MQATTDPRERTVCVALSCSPADLEAGRLTCIEGTINELCAMGDYFATLLAGAFRESTAEGLDGEGHVRVHVPHLQHMSPRALERFAAVLKGAVEPTLADALAFWGALAFVESRDPLARCSRLVCAALGVDVVNATPSDDPSHKARPSTPSVIRSRCPDPYAVLCVSVLRALGRWDAHYNPMTAVLRSAGVSMCEDDDDLAIYSVDALWERADLASAPDTQRETRADDGNGTRTFMAESQLDDLDRDLFVRDYMAHGRALCTAAAATRASLDCRQHTINSPWDSAAVLAELVRDDDALLSEVLATTLRDWARPLLPADQTLGLGATLVRPLSDLAFAFCTTVGTADPARDGRNDNDALDDREKGKERVRDTDKDENENENGQDTRRLTCVPSFAPHGDDFNDALCSVCPHFAPLLFADKDDGGLLDGANVVTAGGAVVYALQSESLRRWLPGSDLDVWIVGESAETRRATFERTVRGIFAAVPDCEARIVGSTVTFTLSAPLCQESEEVLQVIYTDYANPVQLVCDYDMTHVCAYFDGRDVWATWDCVASVVSRRTECMPGMTPRPDRVPKAIAKGFECDDVLPTPTPTNRRTDTVGGVSTSVGAATVSATDVHVHADDVIETFDYRPMSCEGYRRALRPFSIDPADMCDDDNVAGETVGVGDGTQQPPQVAPKRADSGGEYRCGKCDSTDPTRSVCLYDNEAYARIHNAGHVNAALRHPWSLRTPPLVTQSLHCRDCWDVPLLDHAWTPTAAVAPRTPTVQSDKDTVTSRGATPPTGARDSGAVDAVDPDAGETSSAAHMESGNPLLRAGTLVCTQHSAFRACIELAPLAASRPGRVMTRKRSLFAAFLHEIQEKMIDQVVTALAPIRAWTPAHAATMRTDAWQFGFIQRTRSNLTHENSAASWDRLRLRVNSSVRIMGGLVFERLPLAVLVTSGLVIQGTVSVTRMAGHEDLLVPIAHLTAARIYPPTFFRDVARIARGLDPRHHPQHRL